MAVPVLKLVLFFLSLLVTSFSVVQGTSWCVARSDASYQALQTALDYACGSGADCSPLQSSGLCFLPNTIQAHASYAFNSYYQRRAMAPGSCDFAGTATVAKTDPSYGSCVYPSSASCNKWALTVVGLFNRKYPTNAYTAHIHASIALRGSSSYEISSTAGGIATPTTPTTVTNIPNAPTTTTTTPINSGDGSTGLNNPGLTPPIPTTDESGASFDCVVTTRSMSITFLLVLSFILHPMWIF